MRSKRERAVELYSQGVLTADICSQLGIATSTLYIALRDAGVSPGRPCGFAPGSHTTEVRQPLTA